MHPKGARGPREEEKQDLVVRLEADVCWTERNLRDSCTKTPKEMRSKDDCHEENSPADGNKELKATQCFYDSVYVLVGFISWLFSLKRSGQIDLYPKLIYE